MTVTELAYTLMQDFVFEPWPWYVTGPLIGLFVPGMLLLGSSFGISGNLETICSAIGAGKVSDYFKFDITPRIPGLLFVIGSMLGGFLTGNYLTTAEYKIDLNPETIYFISELGVTDFSGLQPAEMFSFNYLFTWEGTTLLCFGGFLIGFGTRYAGGCTSGHSINGLSALRPSSLIATIGFFVGGLITTHFILPLILVK